jgi:uncharacterized protein YjbJ (UPF0337 family)
MPEMPEDQMAPAPAPGGELPPETQPQLPGGPPAAGAAPLPEPDPAILSPIVQEHMDELEGMRRRMPPDMEKRYNRVLAAGMKLMYSDETAALMNQIINDKDIPVANKIGEGVANLVVMLDNHTNGQMPKELLIPVGTALVMEAADFLFEVGVEVTEQDLGKALELMLYATFLAYGGTEEQVDAFVKKTAADMGFTEGEIDKASGDVQEVKGDLQASAESAAPPVEVAPPADEEAAFAEGFAQTRGKGM